MTPATNCHQKCHQGGSMAETQSGRGFQPSKLLFARGRGGGGKYKTFSLSKKGVRRLKRRQDKGFSRRGG
jgi:hypothetical protein